MKNFSLFFAFYLLTLVLAACNQKPKEITPGVPEANLTVNTFKNDSTGVDSLVLVDGNVAIVAKPMDAATRMTNMSDDEIACLKKCKKADGSYDLNCILLCPVSKKYSFTVATRM